MRQIALIPAGCQPWYANVVASTVLENKGDGQPVARFAYCSTMAIYMYDYYAPKLTAKAATAAGASTAATGVGTFKLRKIYADFDASTTTIAW